LIDLAGDRLLDERCGGRADQSLKCAVAQAAAIMKLDEFLRDAIQGAGIECRGYLGV
jgi:hypothetical protein